MRHFRAMLRGFDLTEQQWRVLRALSAIPECEVTQLANATFLLPPSLSRILKDLDDRGLIRRRSSDRDMRFGIVSLSPVGLRLIEQVAPSSEGIYTEMSRRYGAARLATLMDMLRDLETALGSGDLIVPGARARGAPGPAGNSRPRRGRPRKAR